MNRRGFFASLALMFLPSWLKPAQKLYKFEGFKESVKPSADLYKHKTEFLQYEEPLLERLSKKKLIVILEHQDHSFEVIGQDIEFKITGL